MDVYKKVCSSSKSLNKPGSFVDKQISESKKINSDNKTRKCFKCGDDTHLLKDGRKKDFVGFKCNQPGHRASECKIDGKFKQDQNTNVVQDRKEELKPLSIFTPSGLELKTVQYKSMMFQGLVDTGADLCLIRRSVYT
ncbi:hypothetical protein A7M48_19760 [Acinetobacter baumannii]|nr:hypothetical protein A7M48_19760 [Acinetobacter baumannii]